MKVRALWQKEMKHHLAELEAAVKKGDLTRDEALTILDDTQAAVVTSRRRLVHPSSGSI